MLTNIGEKIRILRKQKGLGLNELAAQLECSRSYLANLETGKTDTIQFSFLDKLQEELNLFPEELIQNFMEENEFDLKLKKMNQLLKELELKHPEQAHYFVSIVEQGVNLFSNSKD
ncbi:MULTISPECIES: helix-turn-helix domain-containing protein [Priestia]|uniref:helix-turn-helix domain-containing protein n=1 Tax=Priestia TaxID=2800373 RepID=UPI001C24632F|nr:helix-turn-helix transcriptional regulator [Priestia megaterium]MBU8852759.1 helix-turn-helix domain-containing protein [Bacillus sp. FJAT-26377]MCU7738875.1 helix-turn-helix domain-containing protein [Priestia megaterium]